MTDSQPIQNLENINRNQNPEESPKPPQVGTFQMFRFADRWDKLLIIGAIISSLVNGALVPLFVVFWGDIIDQFGFGTLNSTTIQNAFPYQSFYFHGVPGNGTVLELCQQTLTDQSGSPVSLENWESCLTYYQGQTLQAGSWEIDWSLKFWDQTIRNCWAGHRSGVNFFLTPEQQIKCNSFYFVLIAIAAFISGYFQVHLWMLSALHQADRIRKAYYRSVMAQDYKWFDQQDGETSNSDRPGADNIPHTKKEKEKGKASGSGQLINHITQDVNIIQDGIGDKLGSAFQYNATALTGLIIGLVLGPKMAAVIIATAPLLVISGSIFGVVTTNFALAERKAYSVANEVADEVLSQIKTVQAFNGQRREMERYKENLAHSLKSGIRQGVLNGLSLGISMFFVFGSYALALWWGTELIKRGELTVGDMVAVFFAVLLASFSLGQAQPGFQAWSKARAAAYHIFQVIDSDPDINSLQGAGDQIDDLKGLIEFRAVHFHYLARPDVPVLQGIDLQIQPGSTVAFIGSSGSGKSTLASLVPRLYDPCHDEVDPGSIMLDGVDLHQLNVSWLRSQIGIVRQQPVLFDTSIAENICYGYPEATQEDVEWAAQQAEAHDFIQQLPQGYDTWVGSGGSQLSGGQKQRIAIARAIVRRPKILILDEATSALDSKSETIVQKALNNVSSGPTTVVIAHRLSTIRNADQILVVDQGQIIERGNHQQLLALNGRYAGMIREQTPKDTQPSSSSDHDPEPESESKPDPDPELEPDPPSLFDGDDLVQLEHPIEQNQTPNETESLVSKYVSHLDQDPAWPWELLTYGRPELGANLIGLMASVLNGTIYPVWAWMLAVLMGDLTGAMPGICESRVCGINGSQVLPDGQSKYYGCCAPPPQNVRQYHNSSSSALSYFPWGHLNQTFRNESFYRNHFESYLSVNWTPTATWLNLNPDSSSTFGFNPDSAGYAWAQLQEGDICFSGQEYQQNLCLSQVGRYWALMFFYFSLAALVFNFVQSAAFGYSGEKLTYRLRKMVFNSYLKQEIGYFDQVPLGTLLYALGSDTEQAKTLVGNQLGNLLQMVSTIVCALVIACWACYKQALVTITCFPLVAFGSYIENKMLSGFSGQVKKAYHQSTIWATETIRQIRTIITLNGQTEAIRHYNRQIEASYYSNRFQTIINGLMFGFSQLMMNLIWAISFWYSAVLSADPDRCFGPNASNSEVLERSMTAVNAIIFASIGLGQIMTFTRGSRKTKIAINNTLNIIRRTPVSDLASLSGDDVTPDPNDDIDGRGGGIEFQAVQFRYPSRPEVGVLDGISFRALPGQTIALVGSSGSGKSTIIQLLERFYETDQGQITLNRRPIDTYDRDRLRSIIGLVEQEPRLFRGTIGQNIAYPEVDYDQTAVQEAAQNAHIHHFIMSLPQGYDTEVGSGGNRLSGGQKQRLALARALIKKPQILLLDEPTSALDVESEKRIQEAIDDVRQKCTTIIVAHRLSTIRSADLIMVVKAGKIIESGTHDELINLKAEYHDLVQSQMNDTT